jgi:regulator of ribonuclease activity A
VTKPSDLTADIFDQHGSICQSCPIQLKQFGQRRVFSGPIRTVKCKEDNALIRQTLEKPSSGEVLVVDGRDSLNTALLGDMLASLGSKNGWAGIIIFGAVRDVAALALTDFGIKALGSNPRKSTKTGEGAVDVVVTKGPTTFTPGHWLYSDDDGILVAPHKLH